MNKGTTELNSGSEMRIEEVDDKTVKDYWKKNGFKFCCVFSAFKDKNERSDRASESAKDVGICAMIEGTEVKNAPSKIFMDAISNGLFVQTSLRNKAKTAGKATRKTTTQRPNKPTGQKPTADRHDDRI